MNDLSRLHDDHALLRPSVDALRGAADEIGHASVTELRRLVAASRAFLLTEVLPHAGAEEDVVYPALQRAMGSPRATVGMEHDHAQIRKLTAELGEIESELGTAEALSNELASKMRRVMYGLYAIVLTHFEKEEELYLPNLASLSAEEASDLVGRMEAAIERHKAALAPA